MNDSDFILLESTSEQLRPPHHVIHTISIFAFTVIFASTGILPIPIVTFIGATLMIGFNCISLSEAIKAVDKRVVLLIVGNVFYSIDI